MRISDWSSDVCSSDLDPQRARALALQPVKRGGEQLAAPAAVLVFAQQVEALELAVAGRDVRVRQAAVAGGGVAARGSFLFDQPDRIAWIHKSHMMHFHPIHAGGCIPPSFGWVHGATGFNTS